MKPMRWPRYLVDRRLADGRTAYYWTPRTRDIDAGFPGNVQALGTDYSEAVRRCDGDPNVPGDRGLNGLLDDWRRGIEPPTGAPEFASLKWLFHRFEQTRAFTRNSDRTKMNDRRFMGLINDTPLTNGSALGSLSVQSISARAVDKLYERLSAPRKTAPSAQRAPKNKRAPPPSATNETEPKRTLRQANKCLDVAARAWRTVHRLHPSVVPKENPFEGVTREHNTQETIPATRQQAYVLAQALVDLGHPSLGLVALAAFEWHQRPENILAGHLQWSNYRPADRPRSIKVEHAKTKVLVWLPLEDDGGLLFPEIEEFIAKQVKRVGIPMVLTPGFKGKPRPYSFFYARDLVRRARRAAGLPEHVTLAACRHGGMTELGDAEVTEQGAMSLSGHRTPDAARLYIKRTEIQRAVAARRRRAWVDAEQRKTESRNDEPIAESK
jgi:hypothetical protein